MRAQVSGWGMNVYAQSVDYKSSCGMCGNFDGSASNDAPAYVVRQYSQLKPCMQVNSASSCDPETNSKTGPSCDIWNYKPPKESSTTEDLPVASKICPYEPPFIKPLIGSQDDEDITEFLKRQAEVERAKKTVTWDPELGQFVDVEPYDKTLSEAACKDAFDKSDMIKLCKARYGEEYNTRVNDELEDCAQDYHEFGGPKTENGRQVLVDSFNILEQACVETFVREGDKDCPADDEACKALLNVLCPEECNSDKSQGTCKKAKCDCAKDFAGEACNIRRDEPPTIQLISENTCDTHGTEDCPEFIIVEGSGFYCDLGECNEVDATQKHKCRFVSEGKTTVTDGKFIGEDAIQCKVPLSEGHGLASHHSGDYEVKTTLEVSNDGKIWSDEKIDFLFYDYSCVICNETTLECDANPNSCQITVESETESETKCYDTGAPDPTIIPSFGARNPCLFCQPSISSTEFTVDFNHEQCHPKFSQTIYEHFIIGSAQKGSEILTVDGNKNEFVNTMKGYKVTYKILHNFPESTGIDNYFSIDDDGKITLLESVSLADLCNGNEHCAANPTVFNGFFPVEACFQGYCSTTTVVIELVAEAKGKTVFTAKTFYATITENAKDGTQLNFGDQTLLEDDLPDNLAFSIFSSPVNLDNAFAIGKSDAKITVKDSSKLDYEEADVHHCARHRNSKTECDLLSGICVWDEQAPGISKCLMKPSHMVIKATADQGATFLADIAITVIDVEEPPSKVELDPKFSSVDENSPVGTEVGKLLCIDPEQGRIATTNCEFSLAGQNSDLFSIDKRDDASYLLTKASFNHEDVSEIVVEIDAEDLDGNKMVVPEKITIEIVDKNEAPKDITLKLINGDTADGTNDRVFNEIENTPIGTVLGELQASDEDEGNQGFQCQVIDSADGTFSVVSNNLQLAKELDFETAKNGKIQFSIACIDSPDPNLEDNEPIASDEYTFTVNIIDANDAPGDLQLDQSTPIPEEGEPESGSFVLGTLSAEDPDKGASDFSVTPLDTETFKVVADKCTGNNPKKCTFSLELLKPLSASDAACDSPTSEGIICRASFKISDGNDPNLNRDETIEFKMTDKIDLPTGITCSFSTLPIPVENSQSLGKCTVDDVDGTASQFSEGHSVVMISEQNAIELVAATRRRRDDEAPTWEAVVKVASVLNNLDVSSAFTTKIEVVDLANDVKVTFDKSFQVVSSGEITTEAATTIPAGDIAIDTPADAVIKVPFGTASDQALTPTVKLTNGVRTVSLVKKTEGAGCQSVVSRNDDFKSCQDDDCTGVFCEDPDVDFSATLVDETTVELKSGKLVETYGGTEEEIYIKTESKTGNVVTYLKLELRYEDACAEQTCNECTLCAIDSVPTPELKLTVTCDPADRSNGFICGEQAAVVLIEECLSCNSDCDLVCDKALDVINDDLDESDEAKGDCGNPVCQLKEINEILDTLDDKEAVCKKISDESCASVDQDKKDAKDEQESITEIEIIKCENGDCGTLTELSEEDGLIPEVLNSRANNALEENNKTSGSSKDNTGVIIAVVVVLLLLIIVIVALVVIRNKQQQRRNEMTERYKEEGVVSSTTIGNQAFSGEAQPFTPGVSNPLYDWYRPDMSRQDCTTYLEGQGEGAFIVRDSQATPGWHMLCVKTQNQVVHDKIRLTDEGLYELLPTLTGDDVVVQPKFKELPDLIDHYVEAQPGMPYVLALANPIYDNHNLQVNRDGYQAMAVSDPNAPMLAPKGAPIDGMSNPMYGAGQGSPDGTYAGAGAGDGGYALGPASEGTYAEADGGYGTTMDVRTPYLDIAPDSQS